MGRQKSQQRVKPQTLKITGLMLLKPGERVRQNKIYNEGGFSIRGIITGVIIGVTTCNPN